MRRPPLSLPLVLCLAVASAARAQTATLIADAHINSAQPAVNSGSLTNLNVGSGYTALLQFDLSLLPPSLTASQVSRAVLRVYCNRADQPGPIAVAPIAGSWSESTVTYATAPPLGSVIASAQVPGPGVFVAFDVTNLVQDWLSNPASNHGLALTSSSAILQFDSKENDLTAHPATLELQLALGAAGPAGPTGAAVPSAPWAPQAFLESPAPLAHKASRVPPEHSARKVPQELKASPARKAQPVPPAHKVRKEFKAHPVPEPPACKAHKARRVRPDRLAHKVRPAPRVRAVAMARQASPVRRVPPAQPALRGSPA